MHFNLTKTHFAGVIVLTFGISISRAAPDARLLPLLESHCFDCHDSGTQKGKLNLEEMSFDLSDPAVMATWVKVHDRLEAGEMPPKKKKAPPEDEKAPFLTDLAKALIQSDLDRAAVEGRSTWRRMNRFEYENTLRDLFTAPWLEVKEILPEDGIAHRFQKSGEALDISHVQLARYMEAADEALRSVIVRTPVKPLSTVRRFYARDQGGMKGKVFFNEFNSSAYRAMFPLLETTAQPDVITQKAPITVGDSNPDVRNLEALGVVASSYEPIQPRFDQFKAPMDARYKLRIMAQTFTAKAIDRKNWIDADRNETFPGMRDEPVSLYAIQSRAQRKLASIDVTPEAKVTELDVQLLRGDIIGPDAARLFRSRPPGPFHNPLATMEGIPGVAYRWLEVEGPLIEQWPPAGHQLLFGDLPINPGKLAASEGIIASKDHAADSKRLLANFIATVYRRPARDEDTALFLPVIEAALSSGSNFTDAMIAGYTSVLCSPGFLCFEEPVGKLDDHSVASRLSYFLWNSTPDPDLRALAGQGDLANPDTLRAQTERLLADPKSERFIDAFLDSWLDLRHIHAASPDATLYPDYYLDDLLTESALDETRLFFSELVHENLPARNLIESEFIFANERLADHYGIAGVKGVGLRKIKVPENSSRGGLMTQASILKVTANGTTTSPVVRGNWILERILGEVVPPPPPGTPAVEPDIRGAVTIRQQLEKHRESASCNTCHVKIDPAGFALESFDVFGAHREHYRAFGEKKKALPGFGKNGQPFEFYDGLAIDSTGQLANGDGFTDIRSFKKLLLRDERAIARNLARKLITYATGSPVRFGDRPILEDLLNKCEKSGYALRDIIHEIIQSPLFLSK